MKIKKTKKSKKQRGNTTYGHGARKKWKGKGHHGGKGMAGTGKRADQKKTLITKLYGNKYFGKQGITSKKTAKKKIKVMNLEVIERNINKLKKEHEKQGFLDLSQYKILGEGNLKSKLKIKAKEFSKSAKEKIEKLGGEVIEIKKKVEKKEESRADSADLEVNKRAYNNAKQDEASPLEPADKSNASSKDLEVNDKKPDTVNDKQNDASEIGEDKQV